MTPRSSDKTEGTIRETIAGVLCLLVLLTGCESGPAEPEARPSSVLLILADDLRADVFGAQTPNLNELATAGIAFTNAFVVSSVCSPSRATIFSGLNARDHGVLFNDAIEWDRAPPNLFEQMEAEGYRVGFVGKWHLGSAGTPPAWFDRWVSFDGQGRYRDPQLNIDGDWVQQKGHMSELLTTYALQFMQGDEPWFLTVSYKAVHQPTIPLPEFEGTLANMPVTLPASFDDSLPHPLEARRTPMPPDRVRDFVRQYYEGVASLDHVIGDLLEPLPPGALVVFVSDNGFLLGEHGMIDKRVAYEESIRIPLIVRYPPWGVGARADIALNLDIGATILDAVRPGSGLGDGRSLRTLTGRSEFEYEYFLDPRWPKTPPMTAIRTLTTKVVSYEDGTVHRFDLEADPDERSPVVIRID